MLAVQEPLLRTFSVFQAGLQFQSNAHLEQVAVSVVATEALMPS